jgi:hypothetical protein
MASFALDIAPQLLFVFDTEYLLDDEKPHGSAALLKDERIEWCVAVVHFFTTFSLRI